LSAAGEGPAAGLQSPGITFPFPWSEKFRIELFATLSNLMVSQKAVNAARVRDARIQGPNTKSWIREGRENDVFPFPGSIKYRIGLFATL